MRSSLTLLALALLAAPAAAQTVYVDANATTGLNDGSSWANAHQGQNGLQVALTAATSGNQIFVAQGLYEPTAGTTRGTSFALKNGVALYGGFQGTETSPAQRAPLGTFPSTLSGDLAGNDGTNQFGDNSFHVVNGAGAGASAILNGFFVQGGNSNGTGNNDTGGGILCIGGSSPTVQSCVFQNNRCTFGGGAGYINGTSPTFTDCQFIDNVGGSFGGAFDMASASNVRFDRCTFVGNRASRAGALEIFATSGVIVSNCMFYDNTATGGSGGGALWIGNGGSTQIRNCTVVQNSATSNAVGGIRNQGSTVSVTNCVVWDNTGTGGAIASANQISAGVPTTYSIVRGGFTGVGNTHFNPQFVDFPGADFRIKINSPGVDAGNNSAVPAGLTLDLDQRPRFVDAPSVADGGLGTAPLVDIGAYEFVEFSPVAYCSGDGSAAPCPCANPGAAGAGCANMSTGQGAVLSASGSASLAAADLAFDVTSMPNNQPALLFTGTTQIMGGTGTTFGDGLRCVGGSVTRLGVQFAGPTGMASWAAGVVAPAGINPGETRYFQAWYREPGGSCGTGFNLSQGLGITFQL